MKTLRQIPAFFLCLLLAVPVLAQPDLPISDARTAFITMHTDVRPLQLYREACLQQIIAAAREKLPRNAEGRVPPGRLLLSLEIDADGALHSARVLQAASSRYLTASALDMVRGAAPFPALSTALKREYDRVVLTLPLDFGG